MMGAPETMAGRKAALREEMRARLRAVEPAERCEASLRACARLEGQDFWRGARRLLCFAPRRDELDLWPVVRAAWAAGKVVALPRFVPGAGEYTAALVRGWEGLRPGRLGILEPDADAPTWALNQLDAVLVPGLAFSTGGCRLGRGKGFYDRLLAGASGLRCGVGWDFQVFPELPAESHDEHLDYILTPTRWVVCPSRAVVK